MSRWQRTGRLLTLGFVLAVALLYFAGALGTSSAASPSSTTAPNFTLKDIYGQNFTLSQHLTTDVVVVEFTSLSCSECQVVEKTLQSLYAGYNQSGQTNVQILSVYIEPQFGDTIPALQSYHDQNQITWYMAQDTSTLAVSKAYGVSDIPTVVVIDKSDQPVYDVAGVQSTSALASTINSAEKGTAPPIALVSVSVFALAAIAGVTTFFSPCAFPMFPGYMSLYLGLDATRASSEATPNASYKGAVRRALSAGSVSALGMMIVFLVIGVALVLAASLVGRYVPYLLILVGIVLVGLGALLLTNLQYWRVVTPFQRLWGRLTGKDPSVAPVIVAPAAGERGFYLKLFGYGMGYAAAAAGCVAPVILSAIVAGLALGLVGGLLNILIYSITAAVLMIVVTVALAVAGRRYVNRLKAITPIIKKVSAVALLVVGAYLIYFYYTAWIR
ncbi:MAG: cytochrome c biogenesis protein CcdA [Thermoplasmata archaeon]